MPCATNFAITIFFRSCSTSRSRPAATETVKVLAGLARFVIADITEATEVRVELHNIVRDFPSLPVQPILLRGEPVFISMQNLRKFPWVLPTLEYDPELAIPDLTERAVRL